MLEHLQLIDTNTNGVRYDVTPLFSDYESFSALVEDISRHFSRVEFEYVAGIDALGFILGTAVAIETKKGFIPVRKGGKLPVETESICFRDYSGQQKSLEIRKDVIVAGKRVLLVDEWVETGAQMSAAIELIESQGGIVAGVATINIDENDVTKMLMKKYNCYEIWKKR